MFSFVCRRFYLLRYRDCGSFEKITYGNAMDLNICDAYHYTPCIRIMYVSMLRNSMQELERSNGHSVECCQSVINIFYKARGSRALCNINKGTNHHLCMTYVY